MEWHMQYINQVGRSFHTRYKEHIRTIKYNKDTSAYANHVFNTKYYGNNPNSKEGQVHEELGKISYLLYT
jgi:hypothetical protein